MKRTECLACYELPATRGLWQLSPASLGPPGGFYRIEPIALHHLIYRFWSADLFIKQISRGVVANDYHKSNQVFDRQRSSRVQRADYTCAGTLVRFLERHSIRERKLAGLDLAVGFDHQRDLDHAHCVHRFVGVRRDLFAGFDALDVDSPLRVDRAGYALDVRLQACQRRCLLRLLKCTISLSEGHYADEHTQRVRERLAHNGFLLALSFFRGTSDIDDGISEVNSMRFVVPPSGGSCIACPFVKYFR